MAQDASRTASLQKLIAIRSETLAMLRQDAARLKLLRDEAESKAHVAAETHSAFIEEIRLTEPGQSALFADQMQSRRHYLAFLDQQVQVAQREAGQIADQYEKAHLAVENCHKDIRVLERLVQRREHAWHQEIQRRDYVSADDAEMLRQLRGREMR